MRFYCPRCWKDFDEDKVQCPHCFLNIHDFWHLKGWVEKLILALDHPEANTPIRAAWLLGKKKVGEAVAPLLDLIGKTKDVYIMQAAVRALAEIGTWEAREGLRRFGNHPVRLIREEIQTILKHLDENPLVATEKIKGGDLHEK